MGAEYNVSKDGILIPNVTAVERAAIATPVPGLTVYQSDGVKGLYYYEGSSWLSPTITGSVANTQIPYGTASNTLGSTAMLTHDTNGSSYSRTYFKGGTGSFQIYATSSSVQLIAIKSTTLSTNLNMVITGGLNTTINANSGNVALIASSGAYLQSSNMRHYVYSTYQYLGLQADLIFSGLINLGAGTTTRGLLKVSANSVLLTTPEARTLEVDASGDLYWTNDALTRTKIN